MSDTANPKLDPILAKIVEQPEPLEDQVIVIVALSAAPDLSELAALAAAGLNTRSVVGDIITGLIAAVDLPRLAAVPLVIAIEGSRPLEQEQPPNSD